ncbi:MAG TPA: hypothetical protein VFG14_15810, partial [Chthoniobacteraceae bacterium]|nr:hypothetical protein [Chthoniobacteraceae bacterium]
AGARWSGGVSLSRIHGVDRRAVGLPAMARGAIPLSAVVAPGGTDRPYAVAPLLARVQGRSSCPPEALPWWNHGKP